MSHYQEALMDPHVIYHYPKDVLADTSLSRNQKINVLKQWQIDAKSLLVADEENMAGADLSENMLSRVMRALDQLKA